MRACIFGAGEYHGERLDLTQNALIIAADGGFCHTQAYGLTPSLLIGDFDSLEGIPLDIPIKRYPVKKDDTDLALAVKEALAAGCDEIVMFGVLGGRLDHTLANITLLLSLAKKGVLAYLVGKGSVLTVLSEKTTLVFPYADGGLSLFTLTEEATVTIEGVDYPLSSGKLYSDCALGVSNRFLGQIARISAESGKLLVIWENEALAFPKTERSSS